MSRPGTCATLAAAGAMIFSLAAVGGPPCKPHPSTNSSTQCCQIGGPDVIVGSIPERANYTSVGDLYDAFSFATTSCNVGDANLSWIDEGDSNLHPVIGQGMFKLKGGRFEQIGLSWLKHGFFALQGNACGCGCISSGNGNLALGIGCSDPYDAARNGEQGSLGPRWQVNPHTGVFSSPHDNPPFAGNTERRLRVKKSDLEPSSGTVRYFVEAQYVTQDDAQSGNGNNNASYRQIAVTQAGSEFAVSSSFPSGTQREQPGIRAWQDIDPLVTETDVQIEGDGLFIVAAKATDLGGGMWHYEYAVQNLNSDRAGGSFSVPIPPKTVVSNIGFHDVEYHAFDGIPDGPLPRNFDGADWSVTEGNGSITWTTVQTFTEEPNANALRWGTLYNFRFDADVPPGTGDVTIGLFKPGTPSSANAATVIPVLADCPADIVGNDGMVDVNDLLALIGAWGAAGGAADINGDNIVDVNDLLFLIGAWGEC